MVPWARISLSRLVQPLLPVSVCSYRQANNESHSTDTQRTARGERTKEADLRNVLGIVNVVITNDHFHSIAPTRDQLFAHVFRVFFLPGPFEYLHFATNSSAASTQKGKQKFKLHTRNELRHKTQCNKVFCSDTTLADIVALPACAAVCCPASDRYLLQLWNRQTDGRTDGQTDSRQMHRPCSSPHFTRAVPKTE